jgi:hypothetical protein
MGRLIIEEQAMDMKLMQRARALIADEIEGCSFQSGNKQDALQRAEDIIAVLEAAGIVLSTAEPIERPESPAHGGFQTQVYSQPRRR